MHREEQPAPGICICAERRYAWMLERQHLPAVAARGQPNHDAGESILALFRCASSFASSFLCFSPSAGSKLTIACKHGREGAIGRQNFRWLRISTPQSVISALFTLLSAAAARQH
jgi:hypothetical protein